MDLSSVPRSCLQRIIELSDYAEELGKLAHEAERKLEAARDIVNGRNQVSADLHRETKAKFDQIYKASQTLRARATAEASVVVRIKAYIVMLDGHSRFEPVKVDTNGWTLAKVRARLAAITDEIRELEAAPRPSADIKARLEVYVRMLRQAGRPIFYRGLNAEGAELTVMWPGEIGANPRNMNGYSSTQCDALLLQAWLDPVNLLARLLQEVHDVSQHPLPPGKRGARLAELRSEAHDLRFIEEACLCAELEAGGDPVRQVDAPPEAVLLHKVHAPERLKEAPPVERPHLERRQELRTASAE